MAPFSTAVVLSPHSQHAGVVAVVAPYGDGGRHAREYARHGWESVAVTLPARSLPGHHRGSADLTGYRHEVVHRGDLHRTLEQLRPLGVAAVVAGSGLGVALADHLAEGLGLPGNDPTTSALRTDRGLQAAALGDIGIAVPRSLRTDNLLVAQRWAAFSSMPAYVVAAADSSVTAPPAVCRNASDISNAWRRIRQAARHHTGGTEVVIQEHLPGDTQYIVHTVSYPTTAEPTVTAIWAEHRTSRHVHARSDLMDRKDLLTRRLCRYTLRAVDVLGIDTGPARIRIVCCADRGLTLLSARTYAQPSPTDGIAHHTTDHIQAAVRAATAGITPPSAAEPHRDRLVTRISLISPHDGTLDADLLHAVTALPTVVHVGAGLVAGAHVRQTIDRATSPGELVLSSSSPEAIGEDVQAIRSMETSGLYIKAAR
ncbi:glutathione synthetase [Streptomyces sp. NPDC059881]|uniref:glutathione synthetase n=1 Tax=Streptomyces sp. NPDC059881 TaxID=3346986 RepID=UPI003667633A